MKRNWKTSLCGLVAALATAITPALSARWQPVSLGVAGLASSIGLMFAGDARRRRRTPRKAAAHPPTDANASASGHTDQ